MNGLIDALRADNEALKSVLTATEPSLVVSTEATMAKVLLLASASHLEQMTQEILLSFFSEITAGTPAAVEFVRNKAIARQYHTLFQWDKSNVSHFFGLFGKDFKKIAEETVKADSDLDLCIRAFLEVGSLRNQLVHQNYASFVLDKTADDIVELYYRAARFLDRLPLLLRADVGVEDDPRSG